MEAKDSSFIHGLLCTSTSTQGSKTDYILHNIMYININRYQIQLLTFYSISRSYMDLVCSCVSTLVRHPVLFGNSFCLDNTYLPSLNLTAREAARRWALQNSPIVEHHWAGSYRKTRDNKKRLYWNEEKAPRDGLLVDGPQQVDYTAALFNFEEACETSAPSPASHFKNSFSMEFRYNTLFQTNSVEWRATWEANICSTGQ